MRKFRTTAVIFVVGVLASKVMTGLESPLYNRWEGNVRVQDIRFGSEPGVGIKFQIFNNTPSWSSRIVEFEFSGDPKKLTSLGLPSSKVTCDIDKSLIEQGYGKTVYFKLSGDNSICSGLRVYSGISLPTRLEFQGKGQILYAEVKRNNSRGLIVGIMQYLRFNDWVQTGTGDV